MANPAKQLRPSLDLPVVVLSLLMLASLGLLLTPRPELAVIVIAALVLALLALRFPTATFYLIVFVIPFGAYRSLGGPYGDLRIHWLAGGALVLYILLRHLPTKEVPPPALRSRIWGLVALLLVVNLLSTLQSPYPETAARELALLVTGYVFVALAMYFVDRHALVSGLPTIIIWSNVIAAALAVIGQTFGVGLFTHEALAEGFRRGIGPSADPNNLALMLLFTLPFLVTVLLRSPGGGRRLLAIGGIALIFAGLVTTYSRSGAVMLCVALGLILIQHRALVRPRTLGLLLGGAGLAAALVLATVPEPYWRRQASLAARADTSLARRASYLHLARDAFLERPLRGWGTGTYCEVYQASEYAPRHHLPGHSDRRPAHNTYLEFLVGSGIVGLALFLAILVICFRDIGRAARSFLRSGDREMAIATATFRTAFIILLLFLLLFSDIYHKYLLVSLGVAQAALHLARERDLA